MAFGITESGVVYANLGLKGLGLSATNYSAAVTSATGTGVRTYANAAVSTTQAALSESDFATAILTNLGVTVATIGAAAYAALQPAVAGYLNSVGKANYGVVAVQLATILSGLTADGTYGAAAKQLNNAAASAYAYGSNAANTTDKVINVATEAAPVTNFSLTAATSNEILVGTSGNDVFAGTKDSIDAGDKILDSSTTDSDVANLSFNGATPALTLQNIENVNVTVSSVSAVTAADATNFSGVQNLTVTKTDVVVGGSSIVGDKAVTVTGVDATKVAKVTTGAGTKAVSVTQATKAGATIDATTATGSVAVTGAGTVLADTTASTVAITALGDTTEDAKALTINAAKASSVTTDALFTGAVTVNAAAASAVTVNGASGGATINAAKAGATGITVAGIDDSGATITTGSYTKAAAGTISVDGSAGTTDVATISAAGYINLATAPTAQVENLNLSGNGAAVTYTLTGTPVKTTLTGTQDVTVVGASSIFTTNTLVDSTTAGTTTVSLSSVATGDLSKIAADKIQIAAAAGAAANLTVASGSNVEIAKDQAQNLTLTGKTASATLNVSTGDDTAASGATIDIALTNLTFASAKTINVDASIGKLTVGTATNLGASTATLNLTGSKDVNLGTISAAGKAIAAGSFTGALTVNTSTVGSITSGSGADSVTVNANGTVFTVNEGDGNNSLTITAAAATSSFSTGAGDDTIAVNTANSIVVVTGAGSDTVTVSTDSDAIIVGGDGTDTLSLAAGGATNLSDNTNFNFSGFEKVTLDGFTYDVKASVFAGDNAIALTGASAASSVLHVVGTDATTAYTIDASKVTFASTQNATLSLEGNVLADTITGSAKNDTIVATKGADVIDGGSGTDTYVATGLYNVKEVSTATNASNGVVINLGTTAVTNTTVLSTTGSFTADSTTTVAAGTTAYLYGSAHSTNSAVSQTLSNIENVLGTAGNDYIVASSTGGKITGAGGADYIKLGTGVDTVVIAASGDSPTFTFSDADASNTTTAGDTFSGSLDVIYGFTTGTDKLDLTAVNSHASGTGDAIAAGLTANKYQLVRGDWSNATHTFTVASTGADELVIYDVAAGADHALVLVGVAANQLVVGDLV